MSLTSLSKWLLSRLGSLDAFQWYSYIFGGIFSVWVLCYGIYRILNSIWPPTASFILGHLIYPHLFPRIPFIGTATRFEVLIVFLYLLTNILIITIGVKSEIGSRAATMSVINLIPLLCGPRLSLVTKLLGISLRTSISSHQWFGRTAILQVLVHMIAVLTGGDVFTWTTNNVTGVVAGSAPLRVAYRLMCDTVLIAIWRHLPSKKAVALFFRIGIWLWTLATAAHWAVFAFRNLVFNKPFATATARRLSNKDLEDQSLVGLSTVLQVDITIPRPWHVKAGQSVFLSIPKLGIFTGLRGHPFMISWWERDRKGLTISLLVKSRAGFTAELDRHTNKCLRAFIDGPYGSQHDFGEYGTVIMIATGIGIAGHIPYIKELISGYNNCEVKTRRIRLIWEIEDQCQEVWVKHWMDELLDQDTGYILDISIHVLQGGGKKDLEYGDHSRVRESFGPFMVGTLDGEIKNQRGRIMVSLCANKTVADEARTYVRRKMDKGVRLVELDFEPSLRETGRLLSADMEFKCRG
ncbi:hypothetical protein BGZ60DRAFT_403841 [Tricladium varicosporioides]|nr:hypothetical protein BGZ60DRAFT_403841 [Hymenoscyphus varicosporioides]